MPNDITNRIGELPLRSDEELRERNDEDDGLTFPTLSETMSSRYNSREPIESAYRNLDDDYDVTAPFNYVPYEELVERVQRLERALSKLLENEVELY